MLSIAPHRRRSIALAAALAGLWIAPASAQQPPPKSATTSTSTTVTVEQGKFTQTKIITATAVILGLDRASRRIGLQPARGDSFDVVAGPEVQNLDQLNVGDRVNARYAETVSLQLKPAGSPVAPASAASLTANNGEPGAAPLGGVVARQAAVTAKVVAVEAPYKRVTLRAPSGEQLRILVKDQQQFDNIRVGDLVEADYAQAIALSITKAN